MGLASMDNESIKETLLQREATAAVETQAANSSDYGLRKLSSIARKLGRRQERPRGPMKLPRTSAERIAEAHPSYKHSEKSEKEPSNTLLYLAYGSNLCAETFLGNRGIRPLSAVNIQCPELRLTFDLPGLPYMEPCFANTARRNPNAPAPSPTVLSDPVWSHGLVGVVYEVMREDYAHIIATEGGGTSYKDILVQCYLLDGGEVRDKPEGKPFLAHTLFAPYKDEEEELQCAVQRIGRRRLHRPIPDWAQPSARYLKLLTDGAAEHDLPADYQEYLHAVQPFVVTSAGQRVGKLILMLAFGPLLLFSLTLARMFQDKNGKAPAWLAWMSPALFESMWRFYDVILKPIFGEGERTLDDKGRKSTGTVVEPVQRQKKPRWLTWNTDCCETDEERKLLDKGKKSRQ